MKFLDSTGVTTLWNKIKEVFGLGDSKDYLQDFKDANILMGDVSYVSQIKKVINITDKVAIYAFILKRNSGTIDLYYGDKTHPIGSVGEFKGDGNIAILVPFATNFEDIYVGSTSEIWITAS